jgi:hypothetical protein
LLDCLTLTSADMSPERFVFLRGALIGPRAASDLALARMEYGCDQA